MIRTLLVVLLLLPVAAGQGAAPEQWPRLTIPEPAPGDAGVYERSVVEFTGENYTNMRFVDEPFTRETFRVEQPGKFYAADGQQFHDLPIRKWQNQFVDGVMVETEWVTHVNRLTGEIHANTQYENHVNSYAETGASSQNIKETTSWLDDGVTVPYGAIIAPLTCGFHNSLQGTSGEAQQIMELHPGYCRGAYYLIPPETTWKAVRVDEFGTSKAVGYQVQFDPGTVAIRMMWFADGIPFPVRFLEQLNEPGQFAMLDLVAFSRGTPDDSPLDALQDLPRIKTVPFAGQPGDFPTDWNLASAVSEAINDDDVADWLDRHHTAYLASAVYNDHRTDRPDTVGRERIHTNGWYLRFDDGFDAILVSVLRANWEEYSESPAGEIETFSGQEIGVSAKSVVSTGISKSMLASRIATADSAALWWQAMRGDLFGEREASSYSFYHTCINDCTSTQSMVMAGILEGYYHRNETLTAAGSESYTWNASILYVTMDGRASYMVEQDLGSRHGVPSGIAQLLPERFHEPIDAFISNILSQPENLPAEVPTIALPAEEPPANMTQAAAPNSVQTESESPSAAIYVGSAVAGVALVGILWKLLAAGLFSRVTTAKALDHPTRQQLFDTVQENPGIHLQELARRTNLPVGTVRHHLGKLSQVELIIAKPAGGFVAYFVGGARPGRPLPRSKTARRVYNALQQNSGASSATIAASTGISERTVRYHMAKLRNAS